MKRFLIFLCIILLGTFILDGAYRALCSYTYNHASPYSVIGVSNHFYYNSTKSEIAVLGASKAVHHYIPKQIEDSLKISTYNWGEDGRSIIYQYLCLLKAIKNGNLQLVILDIGDSQIGEWVEEHISDIYPYYWESDSVKCFVDEVKGMNMSGFMSSSFIQYNSRLHSVIANWLFAPSNEKEKSKGFVPLPYTGKEIHSKSLHAKHCYLGIKYLEKVADKCRSNNIRLVVCFSPNFADSKMSTATIKKICEIRGIDFWDMSHVISDPLLFSDATHLNEKGASTFTNIVINKIKSEIVDSAGLIVPSKYFPPAL